MEWTQVGGDNGDKKKPRSSPPFDFSTQDLRCAPRLAPRPRWQRTEIAQRSPSSQSTAFPTHQFPLFPTDQFLSPLFTINPASIPSLYFFPRFYHRITFLSAEPLRSISENKKKKKETLSIPVKQQQDNRRYTYPHFPCTSVFPFHPTFFARDF